MKRQVLSIIALAGLYIALALVAFGCYEQGDKVTNVAPPPPAPTEPVTIIPGGTCESEGSSVNCRDESESVPTGELANVRWQLFRGSATLQATKNSAPGDSVSFGPGLTLDRYSVEQRVTATDGSAATATYSNIDVDGL